MKNNPNPYPQQSQITATVQYEQQPHVIHAVSPPIQQQPVIIHESPQVIYSDFGFQPTTTVQSVDSNITCPKCKGNGFTHLSTMTHDKNDNQRCFFCKDCKTCKGNGYIKGKQEIIQSTDIWGQTTQISSKSNISSCLKCKGNGWYHYSTMNHDKQPNQKCFFCKKCKTCGGDGLAK